MKVVYIKSMTTIWKHWSYLLATPHTDCIIHFFSIWYNINSKFVSFQLKSICWIFRKEFDVLLKIRECKIYYIVLQAIEVKVTSIISNYMIYLQRFLWTYSQHISSYTSFWYVVLLQRFLVSSDGKCTLKNIIIWIPTKFMSQRKGSIDRLLFTQQILHNFDLSDSIAIHIFGNIYADSSVGCLCQS